MLVGLVIAGFLLAYFGCALYALWTLEQKPSKFDKSFWQHPLKLERSLRSGFEKSQFEGSNI
jgi:hypothetical protein